MRNRETCEDGDTTCVTWREKEERGGEGEGGENEGTKHTDRRKLFGLLKTKCCLL